MSPSPAPSRIPLARPRAAGRAFVVMLGLAGVTVGRALTTEERVLKSNFQVEYLREPPPVTQLRDLIAQGTLYARSRVHYFRWDWREETIDGPAPTRDHHMLGLGGSLVFRSARYQGWSALVGLYGSDPLHATNTDPAVPRTNFGRTGKDTYRTQPDGSEKPILVLAEALAEYRRDRVTLRAGRQILDTLLLASNDSKMVPNTFEAVRLDWRARPTTRIGLATVSRQKLRDRTAFHSLIAYARLYGNDDTGANRGLTPQNLAAAGRRIDSPLWLLTAEDQSLPHLRLTAEAARLDGLLAIGALEAAYEGRVARRWTLSAALRGLRQWDCGAGAIGGAALSGVFARDRSFTASADDQARLASYRDPRDATGGLLAARVAAGRGPVLVTLGWSRVADRADLLNPWRGFPTAGYTRAMGQIDWFAGTANQMARIDCDLGKNRRFARRALALAYHRMNYDDRKVRAGSISLNDRALLLADATASLHRWPRTSLRIRAGFLSAEARPGAPAAPDHDSYRDLRVELNHLL